MQSGRRTLRGAKPRVRKLEDNYFQDWLAGTELGREGFKRLMRIELRRCYIYIIYNILLQSLCSPGVE